MENWQLSNRQQTATNYGSILMFLSKLKSQWIDLIDIGCQFLIWFICLDVMLTCQMCGVTKG